MRRAARFARKRTRLLAAFLGGVIVVLLLPASWGLTHRLLIGWNIGVWGYLALLGWLVGKAKAARVEKIAMQEDSGALAVLFIMSMAATLSIAAIVLELATVRQVSGRLRFEHYLFTALTVAGSWLLVGVVYAFHYAMLFYRSPPDKRALRFPEGDARPDYWDFLYFSFTIAVAAQTSDISILSRPMRKAVLAQSVLSFIFNVAILGLSINIAAGILGT